MFEKIIIQYLLKDCTIIRNEEIQIVFKTLFRDFEYLGYTLEVSMHYPIFRMGLISESEFLENTIENSNPSRFLYNPFPKNESRCTLSTSENFKLKGPIYTVMPSDASQFETAFYETRCSYITENNCFLASLKYNRDLKLFVIPGSPTNDFQILAQKSLNTQSVFDNLNSLLKRQFLRIIFSDKTNRYYKLSANFFYFLRQNFDGIVYSSVRTNGKGLVMSLFPELSDDKTVQIDWIEFHKSKINGDYLDILPKYRFSFN